MAVLIPRCEIVLVDIKGTSLELAHQKAEKLANPSKQNDEDAERKEAILDEEQVPKNGTKKKKRRVREKIYTPVDASAFTDGTVHANKLRRSKHLKNLYTFHGSITKYVEAYSQFDIGLGLHACGEASDLILRACGDADANFIVSPCCVGKLSQKTKNPYIFRATAQNEATITYPQSSKFCQIIQNTASFDVLAKAADYSEMKDMRTSRNATRRTAKALLETDRLIYMKDMYKYDKITLSRMEPWEASPKNDILIGWRRSPESNLCYPDDRDITLCVDSNLDIDKAANQLIQLETPAESAHTMKNNSADAAMIDWTQEEQDEIQAELDKFIGLPEPVYKFKPGMGKRRRKLIHFLAHKNNLLSWSEGKKSAEKITVIGKKGHQGETEDNE